MKSNFHTHSYLDDGKGKLEEYAESALASGITTLGFSGHAPLPFPNSWTLKDENLPVYLSEVEKVRKNYSDRLAIYKGLEIDYIPGELGPSSAHITKLNLDFTIGSVHMLLDPANGKYYAIDGPDSEFIHLLENVFSKDIKKMISAYFQAEKEMLENHSFDILGHCDLMKKKNRGNKFFDQDENWYRKEALAMLELLAEKNIIMEINTGAIARGYQTEFYPNHWMLKEAFRLGIPITLNSDCHSPEKISESFTESVSIIKNAGYRELQILCNGKWSGTII